MASTNDTVNSTTGNTSQRFIWEDVELTPLGRLADSLDLYCVPLVIFVGFLGNSTSFFVFTSLRLRSHSSSVYLAALAVADNGFLLNAFIMWTVHLNWNFLTNTGSCQIFLFLIYFFSFISVWYVVAFTAERFIAVCFPLKRNVFCTCSKAKSLVIGLAMFAFIFYAFVFWTVEINTKNGYPECTSKEDSLRVVHVMNNIDTVITLIIPMILITVLNIRIAQRLICRRDERGCIRSNGANDSSLQVTKMLLVVSSTFLVLNIPNHAFRVHNFIMGFTNSRFIPSQSYIDCQKFFQFVYYLNFATNFFLYSLCGRKFRGALIARCCGRKVSNIKTPQSCQLQPLKTSVVNMQGLTFQESATFV